MRHLSTIVVGPLRWFCDGFATGILSLNYLCKLSRFIVDCVVHILTWNSEAVGGPIMARGDCLQRRTMVLGGTIYSAMDGPGGPLLGGTTYSMTESPYCLVNHFSPHG